MKKVAILSVALALFAPLFADNPPSAPLLSAPSANQIFTNTNMIPFSWTSSTDDIQISNYTFMCATNGLWFISNAVGTNVLTTNVTFSSSNYTTITWYVIARDNSNKTSNSLTRTCFITNTNVGGDVTPPSAALLISPAASVLVSTSNQSFDWQASTDNVAVSGYVVLILTNGITWKSISNATTNVWVTNTLSGVTNFAWYVKSYDAVNNFTYSSTNAFTWDPSGDQPPTAPVLGVPANFAVLTATNAVTFHWAPATDDLSISNYGLVYRANGGAWQTNLVPGNQTNTGVFFPAASNTNVTIQWTVFAKDTAGQIRGAAATNLFFISNFPPVADLTPPSTPTLLRPVSNTYAVGSNVVFYWGACSDNVGVVRYVLTLTTNGNVWRVVSNGLGTNYVQAVAANFSNLVTWNVRAYDAAGNSSVSATVPFNWFPLSATPTTVTNATNTVRLALRVPSANGLVMSNLSQVTFAWAPAAEISNYDRYTLQVWAPGMRIYSNAEPFYETSACIDLSSVTNLITSNVIRLFWQVVARDSDGVGVSSTAGYFTVMPPPLPGKVDIRPLVLDPVGQQILGTQSNSAAVLEYMAGKSNTVIPPIYSGEEVPLKYKVDEKTGVTLTARYIRVYDRKGRLIFEKPAPRGTFASWDKKDKANRPVPAGMYVVEIVYDDNSTERAMTVVPK